MYISFAEAGVFVLFVLAAIVGVYMRYNCEAVVASALPISEQKGCDR